LTPSAQEEKMKRIDKFQSFQQFKAKSKEIFEALSEVKSNQELKRMYGFSVAPGSRHGGLDPQIIEVFYGQRPVHMKQVVNSDFTVNTVILNEMGANLYYQQLDNGNVHVSIYPAWTETLKPIEEFIIVDYIRNPKKLLSKRTQRKHFNWLKAYMSYTSIEKQYTFSDWLKVVYLKQAKAIFSNKKTIEPRIKRFLLKALQLIITVGFSGFCLAFIPFFTNSTKKQNQEIILKYDQIISKQSEIINLLKAMPVDDISEINVKLSELNKMSTSLDKIEQKK